MFDRHNDKIYIVAPASSPPDKNASLLQVKDFLDKMGLEYIIDPNIFSSDCLPFYANNLDFRGADFKKALASDAKIIWAIRGGYGSSEVAHEIIKMNLERTDKVLVGFSDITALHFLCNQYYHMPSIHGDVLSRLARWDRPDLLDEIIALVNGGACALKLEPIGKVYEREIQGEVVGGNLTVLTTLIGTQLHPNLHGKILIIEDVGERGYQVMRHLQHLIQAGCLEGLHALIFADFTESLEPDGVNLLPAAIEAFVRQLNIPCFYSQGIGHGEINKPFIVGARGVIIKNILDIENPWSKNDSKSWHAR